MAVDVKKRRKRTKRKDVYMLEKEKVEKREAGKTWIQKGRERER